MKVEEQYEDVLQNIESGIVQVYQQHAALSDWDVEAALEALIQFFNAEARGKPIEVRQLPGIQAEVVRAAKAMCELRLGHGQLLNEHDRPIDLQLSPLTPTEIVVCLKRVRKSVQFWTKSGGRQGYLNYIINFVQ